MRLGSEAWRAFPLFSLPCLARVQRGPSGASGATQMASQELCRVGRLMSSVLS